MVDAVKRRRQIEQRDQRHLTSISSSHRVRHNTEHGRLR